MSHTYRCLSFVPYYSAALHVLAVAPLHNNLFSFDPYHFTPLCLGVYHILVCLSLLFPLLRYSLLLCSPLLRCLFLSHRWRKGRAKLWLL
jgi:hypothetical protein